MSQYRQNDTDVILRKVFYPRDVAYGIIPYHTNEVSAFVKKIKENNLKMKYTLNYKTNGREYKYTFVHEEDIFQEIWETYHIFYDGDTETDEDSKKTEPIQLNWGKLIIVGYR